MAKHRLRSEWDRTAAIRCDVRNFAFGSKGNAKTEDVHPYFAREPRPTLTKEQGGRFLDKVFGIG